MESPAPVRSIAPEATHVRERGTFDGGLSLRESLRLLWRQRKLVLIVVFTITALTTVVAFTITPIYKATGLIIVDPRQANFVDPRGQTSLLPGDMGRVDSEVEILQSPAVLLSVIQHLNLTSDAEFAPQARIRDWLSRIFGVSPPRISAADLLGGTLEALDRRVSITKRPGTYLIEASARSENAEKSALIANTLAESYISAQISAKIQVTLDVYRALQNRLIQASNSVRDAEAAVDGFIKDRIESIGEGAVQQEFESLRLALDAATAERSRLETVIASSQTHLQAADWNSLIKTLESEALQRLNEDRNSVARALEEVDEQGANALDLKARLAELDRQIEAEARTAIDGARQDLEQVAKSEQLAREDLRARVLSSNLPRDVLFQLYQLQQEADASRAVYQDLLSRSKVVEAQTDLQLPDSRIVSAALPPTDPWFPNKPWILLISCIGSAALGCGLAFLRENFVGGYTDEEQVEGVLRIPTLTSIPQLPRTPRSDSRSYLGAEVVQNPLSSYSEAIRRAVLGLEDGAGVGTTGRTILITSALPGEGKTQTAVSIARSMALAERRVLLMDCDLRQPSVYKAMGVPEQEGTVEALLNPDGDRWMELIVRDPLTKLDVLLCKQSVQASTLFSSRHTDQLFQSVREKYDVTVIDSSPLLPVADARLLVQRVDAVLLVIRWAHTSQRDTRAALRDVDRYNFANVPVVAALNMVDRTSVGYGYGGYHAAYHERMAS